MPDDLKSVAEDPRSVDVTAGLVIPPPRADRPPMHANLFNVLQKSNTTLVPLFPYMHPGAMVPAGAMFVGGPGRDYGQFYHHNSVDEIIIAFVARDATLQTGQLYNGGRVHGVNSFLKDQTKAGSFGVFTITQRQFESGAQPEGVSMLCKACRKQLFIEEFDSLSPPDCNEIDRAFHTLVGAAEAMQRFNADPELRKCKECGHENDPFPLHMWGWDVYKDRSQVTATAKQVLLEAGAAVKAAS
jgi:hypothetical protein